MAIEYAEECCTVITPPSRLEGKVKRPAVFLAGSIEQGKARKWQNEFIECLKDDCVIVCNPRRKDWNKDWPNEITFPPFVEQVNWELDHLESASVIAMYFDPNTISPISLEELGLFARSGRLFVCCPEGYQRRGNVQITCERYGIPMFETLDELIGATRKRLEYLRFATTIPEGSL